jgi:Domain of unknown function (DUF4349)
MTGRGRVRVRSAAAWSGATLAAAVLLGACSGGASSGSSSSGSVAAASKPPALVPGVAQGGVRAATSDAAAGPATASGSGAANVDLLGQSIIRTASLTVRASGVVATAGRAEALVGAVGGYVADESTSADPAHPAAAQAVLTLRVPADRLDGLLAQLRRLGTLVTEGQSSSDVTSQVIDVQARLVTQQASVARVRALLAKARTIGEVVEIEGELTQREATLESLEGQAKQLTDQTALATVTMTVVGPAAVPPPVPASTSGFRHGLSQGWHAFVTVTTWLLTGLGAALPFVILALPVLAAVLVLRRRRPRDPGTPPPAAAAGPAA